jgi:alkaline phosphatase D
VKLPASRTPTIPDGLVLEDPLKGQMAALTLADPRALYRQYRLDPDLQAVHARFPFVMLWDDHEFANDCWGDHATDFDDLYGDEASPERFAAAAQAWFEYSPIRKRESIYRSFRWGRHAEFVLIDERSYRDDFVVPEGPIDAEVGHIMANSAFGSRTFVIKDAFDAREATKQPTMIGMPQREWAISTLTSSTATWKLLVSPLVMTQMVIDLTGFEQLLATNPAIVHADSTHNGVAVVDITAQAIEVQFIRTSDVTMPNGHETDVVKFRTALGSRRVEKTL